MRNVYLLIVLCIVLPHAAWAFSYTMPTRSGGNSTFGYSADLQIGDSWSPSSKTYQLNGNAKCNGVILAKNFSISNGSGYFQASGVYKNVRRVYALQAFGITVASGDSTYSGVNISASSTPYVVSKPSLVSAIYTIGVIPCTITAGASASIKYNANATWVVLPTSGTPNFTASVGPAADIAALGGNVVGNQKVVSAGFTGNLTLIKSELQGSTKAFWSASNASILPQAQFNLNWINTTLNGSLQARVTTLNITLYSLTLGSWSGFSQTTPLYSGKWIF